MRLLWCCPIVHSEHSDTKRAIASLFWFVLPGMGRHDFRGHAVHEFIPLCKISFLVSYSFMFIYLFINCSFTFFHVSSMFIHFPCVPALAALAGPVAPVGAHFNRRVQSREVDRWTARFFPWVFLATKDLVLRSLKLEFHGMKHLPRNHNMLISYYIKCPRRNKDHQWRSCFAIYEIGRPRYSNIHLNVQIWFKGFALAAWFQCTCILPENQEVVFTGRWVCSVHMCLYTVHAWLRH